MVIGSRGQDGRLLGELLKARGDAVVGLGRDSIDPDPSLPSVDPVCLADRMSVDSAIAAIQPDQIYYLAAHHRSSEETARDPLNDIAASLDVNARGVVHVLAAIARHRPGCRLFFASSSLIFGDRPAESPQTESTPASPAEPYALCKQLASIACRRARESCGIFASVGVLYNHESRFRGEHFLSRKIVRAAVDAASGSADPLAIGDLDAAADWSDAGDFVDAFTRILDLDEPGDFIVASGRLHTVRDFLDVAFSRVGLDWQRHVVEIPGLLSRRRSGVVGDSSKLRRLTGWTPRWSFEAMVSRLVDEELAERGMTSGRNPSP